jgi:hypothetical protein
LDLREESTKYLTVLLLTKPCPLSIVCNKLRNQLDLLTARITKKCYFQCLIQTDFDTEIKEGGIIYCFDDGTIAGYNQFVYDQADIIADKPHNLYLFKNIQHVNKKVTEQEDFRKVKKLVYKVKNKRRIEENKDDEKGIYKIVQDWQKKSELEITFSFTLVWFPLLLSTGENEAKRKIPGYHVKVTIS